MKDFWQRIKNNLQEKNSHNEVILEWFKPIELLEIKEDSDVHRFHLGVPSPLHKYWISKNLNSLLDSISSEISANYNKPFQLELVVMDEHKNSSKKQREIQKTTMPSPPLPPLPRENKNRNGSINPDYTFSTFVVGSNNEFAHAASFSIAEKPGTDTYNPLFIYGPTGMGKTHLLHAVGNHICQKYPHLRVNYASTERFINECISHLRRQEMSKFRMRYRETSDVLLMDDIQFLKRGETVQEEFFHTLNDFFDKKQQVVVASDRMPKDINGLEDRIRTRLEWGLIADIQMPDIETRVAILRYKAEAMKLNIPQEVITYISRISKRSIRELEGNLNKVSMYSELQGLELNLELTKKVLATHDDTSHISVSDIQKICANHFKVNVPDLKSKSRTKPLVVARQVAMFMVKKYLDKSLVDIGRAFGKDHTTVISSLRRVADQQGKNSDLKKDIDDIEMRIHNITGL